MLNPLTIKRLQAFLRIRRAKWSLVLFAAITLFCLAADWVCPCDPRAVADAKSLAPYVGKRVERVYDIMTVRYSVTDEGVVFDYEGPTNVDASAYVVRKMPRAGYTRVFMTPREPPAVIERELPPADVAFPFPPCPGHPFGLDSGGRDVYARVVHGMRIALVFGLVLALSGILFGLVVGALEGYFAGVCDLVLQRFTEIWSAVPFLYVMIFIGSTLGRSFGVLLVCYAIFNWITVSYYIRAEFLRLRGRPFVEAAKVHGLSTFRILFVHILPNALTPLITLSPFLLMGAIASLAALDFLGFGLPPLTPSCGELLSQAQQFRSAWWLVAFPSAALFVVMLLVVFIGEGLRDAYDPRRESHIE